MLPAPWTTARPSGPRAERSIPRSTHAAGSMNTAASSLTSVGRTTALPPAASISRWTAVSSCADLAQRATTAPSRAKAWATARPMPRPAPVTTTTCPASPPSSDELK